VRTTEDGIIVFEAGGVNNTDGENNTSTETTISSPECCVWYNYSYTIDGDGNVLCVDPNYGNESSVSGDNRLLEIEIKIAELTRTKTLKIEEKDLLCGDDITTYYS